MIYASIEYSKKLAELFPESEWWYQIGKRTKIITVMQSNFPDNPMADYYPALTTDMLLERLPKYSLGYSIIIQYIGSCWDVTYSNEDIDSFEDKSLPNALAKMLLWLKDNNLL